MIAEPPGGRRHGRQGAGVTRLTRSTSYRWIVLAAAFLGVFGAVGLGRFGYSAILPSMQKDLDITSAAAGSLASWNLGAYTVMAAVGGILAARLGSRKVVTAGLAITAAGMLLTGLSNSLVTASAGRLITGLGNGMVLVPSITLMASWFGTRRLGFASSLVSSGAALALVIVGLVVPRIISSGGADGWRLAWYFFAGVSICLAMLNGIVQRDRPPAVVSKRLLKNDAAPPKHDGHAREKDAGSANSSATCATEDVLLHRTVRSGGRGFVLQQPAELDASPRVSLGAMARQTVLDLKKILRSRYAWHLGFTYLLYGTAFLVYMTFFQKRLTVDLGHSGEVSGYLFLIVGVGGVLGGALWGNISDRIGRGRALALMFVVQAIAAALFAWWPVLPALTASAFILGFTGMGVPGVVGAGCGDQFGPVLASAALGFVTVFTGIGMVLGPYLAGRAADAFGTLTYSYLLAAGVFLTGAVVSYRLRETGWAEADRERRLEN
jgi:MFS family permease